MILENIQVGMRVTIGDLTNCSYPSDTTFRGEIMYVYDPSRYTNWPYGTSVVLIGWWDNSELFWGVFDPDDLTL